MSENPKIPAAELPDQYQAFLGANPDERAKERTQKGWDDQLAAYDKALQAEPLITAGQFTEGPAHAVPVAGLLASDPDLAEAELTRSEWESKLGEYLASPRP